MSSTLILSFRARGRPSQVVIALAVLSLIMIVALAVLAPDALGAPQGGDPAGGGNDVGKNLGDFLRDQAAPIFGGVIAIVSILFLINRRYSELGLFVLMAFVVGWLVFSPDSVSGAARDIAKRIFGG
jgi:hypothetical protein